jgi:hypothetical protein
VAYTGLNWLKLALTVLNWLFKRKINVLVNELIPTTKWKLIDGKH